MSTKNAFQVFFAKLKDNLFWSITITFFLCIIMDSLPVLILNKFKICVLQRRDLIYKTRNIFALNQYPNMIFKKLYVFQPEITTSIWTQNWNMRYLSFCVIWNVITHLLAECCHKLTLMLKSRSQKIMQQPQKWLKWNI